MLDLETKAKSSIARPRRVAATFVLVICLAYLLVLGIAAVLLWAFADQWWPATALSFAPRWAMGLPLILLLPLALVWHRRSLVTLVAAGVVLVWPVMGLQISWNGTANDGHAPVLRIMTCNIHRAQLNAAEFQAVLDSLHPDVVVVQDWTSVNESRLFPSSAWNTRRDGELFLASRFPIVEGQMITLTEPPAENFSYRLGAAAWYRLLTPTGAVNLINVHLSSPHAALAELKKFDPTSAEQIEFNSRCRESESESIEQFAGTIEGPVLIVGDFNTPVESTLYRRHWDQFGNAFSAAGFGFGTTHFSTSSPVRIDHILYGAGWRARACWIGPEVGSPHRPLVADMQLVAKTEPSGDGNSQSSR